MLASESRDDLQKQVQSWKDQLQQYGLRLNTSKTEHMECGPRIEDGSIRVDGTELNKVNCFKYLGSKVTSTGDIDQEGRAREERLRWFGHVLRQEEDSVAKTAPKLVSGVRPRGRPKIRWIDRVKLDMIDARLCTADAMDRTKWKTRNRKADPATTRDKR
ncbi:hypothetical protein NECAME_17082 [Necator americanus]|uniref:Reverse transcriptase domain-containing protein n=1 Tax=Necator americanus TaxID=51031 RepID=W2TU28_NECAM|nr:hypothetical protein NECAME_17082 [Necator americanus]ETN84606.1 hypothetical protein NECAME_17082 [Necator americanus]